MRERSGKKPGGQPGHEGVTLEMRDTPAQVVDHIPGYCSIRQISDYPSEVHSAICYGENVKALVAYQHARQYIPCERMRELLRDVFGLSISCGTLAGFVQKFARKATWAYEKILDKISGASVVVQFKLSQGTII